MSTSNTPNDKKTPHGKENNSGGKNKKIKIKGDKEVEVPILEIGDGYLIPNDFEGLRLTIDCPVRTMGMICDLDISLYCYDERARFVERVDVANKESRDHSSLLSKDIDTWDLKRFSLKFLFSLVKPSVTAILIYLDGGPKNFQFMQSLKVTYVRVLKDKGYGDWLQDEDEASGKNAPFLHIFGRTRKNYQGLALCAIYKEGWGEDESSCVWATKAFLEPVYSTAKKEKEEILSQLVVGAVPVLDKYRPRLFSNIRDICTALSSNSLPKLKKKFQKNIEGLNITDFIEVLFKQLYETHPKIIDPSESAYAVAMLQEMFYQIDYNGDQNTNWDEFTTFCVQTGVGPAKADSVGSFSLQQYVIEYKEQLMDRDKVLSAYRTNSLMRYVPETRKILIIPETSDNIQIFDETFNLISYLKPARIQVTGATPSKEETVKTTSVVYDIIYLHKRDFFAFCSSDHSITVTKEMSSMGGRKITYVQHNRFFHTLLHLKLCWSPKHEILCSTASDHGIYGWNIDNGQNIFQITRHSDNITDFICLDHLNVFITCGMDRKIVMWSSMSRRVKGIFIGHARGVRCLSSYETVLLSAGFESEAKIWDLVSKDNVSILRGHRHPIAAAKLMCERSQSEKEQRAITVDEVGIFMLWNIFVQERGSDSAIISPLQVFEMHNPETPINQIRFLAVPFSSASSSTYYSDVIACSTKLMHFVAEKNIQEFIAPSSSVFNEAASTILTAVGKNILTYDIALGYFSNVFENITGQDVCSICMDGERGRRMFIGTNSGELLLLNSMSGTILDRIQYHSKEITAIRQLIDSRSNIFTCSMDGSLRLFEECNGKLHIHTSVENAFAEGMGIISMKLAPSLNVLVALSAGKFWGIWNGSTLKKIMIFDQGDVMTAVEVIGASNDLKDPEDGFSSSPTNKKTLKVIENLLTLALATTSGIYIYTLDTEDIRGIRTFQFVDTRQLYICDMTLLKAPENNSLNYTFKKGQENIENEYFLIAGTDDGTVATWKTTEIRRLSEEKFRKKFENVRVNRDIYSPNNDSRPGTNNSSRPKTNESTNSAQDNKITGKKFKGLKDTSILKSNLFLTGFDEDQPTQPVKVAINCEGILVDEFFQMAVGEKDINYVRAERHWLAHKDSIIMVVPLSAHGCFYTGSHDGYHRIWNLDEDYLGELRLPNITEKMKSNSMDTDFFSNWKFILERIPITLYHEDMAVALVKNLLLSRKEKLLQQQNFNQERRMATAGAMKGYLFDDKSEDEQTNHRKSMLKSLFEVSKAPEDHPPSRLPTKEEKELLKLSLTMEAMNTSNTINFNKANSAPGELESFSVDNKSTTKKLDKTKSIRSLTKSALATKSASIIEQDNDVCMSCLGIPSLWTVPGEKDIFGNKIAIGKNNVPDKLIPPAFSEASLNAMRFEGVIDVEAQLLLRKVAKNADSVSVYERSQPILLIRNPSMSTSVQLPSIDSIKKTEITFGSQKDMYKNAEKVINERENVSKQLVRNSVALARIDANVRKIGSMIHLIQPASHDEVILPKNVGENDHDDINNMRSEDQKMKIRLLKSASQVPLEAAVNARPLDKSSIENWMNKVKNATDFGVDRKDKDKKKNKKREIISQAAVHNMESKLRHAIRAEYKHRLAKLNQKTKSETTEDGTIIDPQEKIVLTTRHLLPYYKLENVIQFMDIFAKVDENFSGDLDVNEWIKLFASLNEESVSSVEARMIFMKLDQDSDGFLTMKELIPVVFSKANREQQNLILKFAQSHLAKNLEADNVFKVTTVELDQLFEAYDTDCVGFIDVSLIKDRIKSMNLSEQVFFFIMSSMSDLADDEMVSLVEFKRLFKIFSRKM